MSTRSNNGGDAFAALFLIALVAGAIWIYVQLKAFASAVGVDFDTAVSMLSRVAVLMMLLGCGAWLRMRRTLLGYAVVGLWVSALPWLTYKAYDMNDVFPEMAMNSTPAWYGVSWVQMLISLALFAAAVWFHWSQSDYH